MDELSNVKGDKMYRRAQKKIVQQNTVPKQRLRMARLSCNNKQVRYGHKNVKFKYTNDQINYVRNQKDMWAKI